MGVLSNLEPAEVFRYFEEICSIPHPSYREKKLSDYCVDFAQSRGLEVHQDTLGNIVIIKEAAAGYEAVEPLIIQGHLDMVCEKEPGCVIDFEKDGLNLYVEGDYIAARGTSLGGDDGIAIAMALAILADDALPHPRIEAVFTVSEEVGMEGAGAVDLSMLKGHKLLNLDSEEEGYFLTSCAGGCRANVSLPVSRETSHGTVYHIAVEGLTGGHSGVEIDKGRANSNLALGRVLLALDGVVAYSLVAMEGGLKDNAIPRMSSADVIVAEADGKRLEALVRETEAALQKEYAVTEPGLHIAVKNRGIGDEYTLTEESRKKVLALVNLLPGGIQSMSADIPGLVETSLNLGVLHLNETELKLHYAVRSSVQSAKDFLVEKIACLAGILGGSLTTEGSYPAWEYRKDSVLREDMVRIYREMYGKDPVIQAIHAGLECGLLADKIEDLDAVSIGPDMVGIHTTEEKLSIASTRRVWEFVLRVIACRS